MAADETPRPPGQPKYSDADAKEIYETAAKIQSETLFTDEDEGLTLDQLAAGARRAGISDKALEAAIASQAREDAQEAQAKRLATERKAMLLRNTAMVSVVLMGLVALGAASTEVKLKKRQVQVETQNAQIENVLQRRHDLIPNLIAVAKATLGNQRELIASINSAHNAARTAKTDVAERTAETDLGNAMQRTVAAMHAEAGNSPAVLRLTDEMTGTENRIAQERRRYNLVAAEYNRAASGFPTRFFRAWLHYPAQYPLFKAESGARDVPRF